jgi:hypothetical protein
MFEIKAAKKIKTHILCSITLFSENRAVYDILWKNMAVPNRPQMAI